MYPEDLEKQLRKNVEIKGKKVSLEAAQIVFGFECFGEIAPSTFSPCHTAANSIFYFLRLSPILNK